MPWRGRRPKVDDFGKQQIRRVVHQMYAERVLPTIKLIQNRLRAETDIDVADSTLCRILHRMHYGYRKTHDNRLVACEKPEAVQARAEGPSHDALKA